MRFLIIFKGDPFTEGLMEHTIAADELEFASNGFLYLYRFVEPFGGRKIIAAYKHEFIIFAGEIEVRTAELT